ncbi:double-strand break repair protein AddB [Sulfitobacter donghicola]|uniref:Helicase n=1 Tax=Sulfitobacter donghicola DSW-25 = KCTC 12864 = JCM 14565 TaxID=1300350 RepID=A0A073IM30_9RHOB|nr:double-strand break repair protein AddB [Sulfitobacter donghicola]KEJ90630.1 helicase [Sulfitobacter donghicola DSW-25 = KCTC 12864 = JCM 14565]KIN67879.1 Double-strand break repair protein AddB [Sulfitobacter donghicola DSW-25 = KCTC 12864 = JCM 14565]
MFEPQETPRVFGLPSGVDFPQALVDGLLERFKGQPPEALARVELLVNTQRMARRLRAMFEAGPARLLPRIRLLTDLQTLAPSVVIPQGVPGLRRRLELIGLISALLEKSPDLASRASLYDLADSLAGLIDEMQGEGVTPDAISELDVTDQSGHWERAKVFLGIVQSYLDLTEAKPDNEARQRARVMGIAALWAENPPAHPIIIAGSTGSRGTTMLLMQAVAKLPQGALVLPGFDFDLPRPVWAALDDPLISEDHPQYRFYHLMKGLGESPNTVKPWHDTPPPSALRNQLVSLSLRPAPVTDAWRIEGPKLTNLEEATKDMTLVLAETPRAEALAIALRLRKAAEDGQTAALITPDRMLGRRVTSALSRWDILPDDSAGTPLQLSPPGRFLRHIAALLSRRLDAEGLLTLLKHPLTHSGDDRNLHQLYTQRCELAIRRHGLPYPEPEAFKAICEKAAPDDEGMQHWADWAAEALMGHQDHQTYPLSHWVDLHLKIANDVAAGTSGNTEHELWQQKAGMEARRVMQELEAEAGYGTDLTAADYVDLVGALLAAGEVRDRDAPHPDIMIWGTLEARVQGADLVILGGLNDGTWPEAPPPDPWLNRKMRNDAGLLLPERRVGLAAHDYQQAVCAKEVWITRSIRSEDAETVPSRWVNRLGNLMGGLPNQGGVTAWKAMIKNGDYWLDQARALEAVERTPNAPRPSPRPPLAARPRSLSVTQIKTLIRDPYAIYARHSLRLRPLNPLVQSPDAPLRGTVTHAVMEQFVKSVIANPDNLSRAHLLNVAQEVLQELVPWPAARTIWLAKLARVADWFILAEAERLAVANPIAFENEARGTLDLADIGFSITGVADRVDRNENGEVQIYDYKTGNPPTEKQQQLFDKQLLIEAAMIEQGAFKNVGTAPVSKATFIGLGNPPKEIDAPLSEEPPHVILANLRKLLTAYLEPDQGFTSRRIVEKIKFDGDYDHLARYGEWDDSDPTTPEDLT